MTVPPDVPTMAPLRLSAFALAASLLSSERHLKELTQSKVTVSRTQCVSCGEKIGEGRAGRKCKACRERDVGPT